MNQFEAFTSPVMGGHHAMIRLAHESKAKPVLGKGGEPEVYPTELEAQRAATEHVMAYLNGNLRRDGDTIPKNRWAEAEALFRPLLVRQSKTKRLVAVERR